MPASSDNTQFWLTPAMKPEWPPLLERGFHPMTLDALRQICVTSFALSKTRLTIMAGLGQLVQDVSKYGIVADLWIDGSFVTEKLDPEDADVVFSVRAELYDSGTASQRQILDALNDVDLKPSYHTHSFVYYEYPAGHFLHESVGARARRYWIRQFGFSRRMEVKGMPVITIPQT